MTRNTDTIVDFGVRVGEVIADLGLTQAAAARRADIDPGRLHHIISGKDYPRLATRQKMTTGWGIPEYVFYMSREQCAAEIQTAKKSLENNLSRA